MCAMEATLRFIALPILLYLWLLKDPTMAISIADVVGRVRSVAASAGAAAVYVSKKVAALSNDITSLAVFEGQEEWTYIPPRGRRDH